MSGHIFFFGNVLLRHCIAKKIMWPDTLIKGRSTEVLETCCRTFHPTDDRLVGHTSLPTDMLHTSHLTDDRLVGPTSHPTDDRLVGHTSHLTDDRLVGRTSHPTWPNLSSYRPQVCWPHLSSYSRQVSRIF